MSGPFIQAGADGGPPDLTKRVRYVDGMVLGVDDFQQEHLYLAGLGRLALRLGVGTGVVSGLKVTAAAVAGPSVEVRVAPGLAVDAAGRLVRVPEEQCADLVAWLSGLKPADVSAKVTGGDLLKGTLTARVTLAFSEIATDTAPVPGEPCRGDDQLTTATRVRDDFQLGLGLDAFSPPRLREALRQYAGWVAYALALTEANPVPQAQWEAKVNAAAKLLADSAAKTSTPDRLLPADLAGLAPVTLHPADRELARRCLEAAAQVLTADLLPGFTGPLLDRDVEAPGEPPRPLVLGELALPVQRAAAADAWALDVAALPVVSMRGRPVALDGLLPRGV